MKSPSFLYSSGRSSLFSFIAFSTASLIASVSTLVNTFSSSWASINLFWIFSYSVSILTFLLSISNQPVSPNSFKFSSGNFKAFLAISINLLRDSENSRNTSLRISNSALRRERSFFISLLSFLLNSSLSNFCSKSFLSCSLAAISSFIYASCTSKITA